MTSPGASKLPDVLMTNTDKFLSLALWVVILGFVGYVLAQEVRMSQQCKKDGGVVVIAANLTAACVPVQQKAPG